MTETLLIGSGNRHKAEELAQLLQGLPWKVVSLADMPPVEEPAEDGTTFEENALKKAHYYGRHFDVACVADDSGLVVDALRGAPGVYSARYAGEGCTYADNNHKLLAELRDVPEARRTARFVCCAVFLPRGGVPHVETGTVEGRIAFAPRGERGFGYDPLFVPEGYDISFAEMDPSLKNGLSHRGRALFRLRQYLERLP